MEVLAYGGGTVVGVCSHAAPACPGGSRSRLGRSYARRYRSGTRHHEVNCPNVSGSAGGGGIPAANPGPSSKASVLSLKPVFPCGHCREYAGTLSDSRCEGPHVVFVRANAWSPLNHYSICPFVRASSRKSRFRIDVHRLPDLQRSMRLLIGDQQGGDRGDAKGGWRRAHI
jgi:hypothetical protein